MGYNPQATSIKPKLALNKRVAFPLSNNAGSNSSQLPPPSFPINPSLPMNPIIPPVVNASPSVIPNNNVPPSVDSGQTDVNEVVNILYDILDNNHELGNKVEDIKKRINVMKTMWIEGKLPMAVQISTTKLVKALKDSDTRTADEIHKSLMVDHVSCVRSWMVAIKQLILHCTAKNELLGIEETEKCEDNL